MSRILAIAALVVLLGAGWFWYAHRAPQTVTLIGTWQSTQDAKFTREFKADGTVTDLYDNASPGVSTWKTFSTSNPPAKAVSFPLEAGATYIQMIDEKTGDVLDFKIAMLTANELQLVYLERGGVLDFTRVR